VRTGPGGLERGCALVRAPAWDGARSCVERLLQEGMAVAVAAPDANAAPAGASFIQCDPRDRASCDRVVERAIELGGGRLDVLVTGAGVFMEGSIESTPVDAFRDIIEANLTSVFRLARACFAPMRAQGGGSMIHVASDAGIRAAHEKAAFSVTSAGVIALAELLAAEGAPHGIRSNAVGPAAGVDASALVAWLASDASSPLSGATLRVDGAAGAAITQDTRS
jgi:NAD(P)-dependent dehydrogenase (short-subunit alcohol dehydrogenase family)